MIVGLTQVGLQTGVEALVRRVVMKAAACLCYISAAGPLAHQAQGLQCITGKGQLSKLLTK